MAIGRRRRLIGRHQKAKLPVQAHAALHVDGAHGVVRHAQDDDRSIAEAAELMHDRIAEDLDREDRSVSRLDLVERRSREGHEALARGRIVQVRSGCVGTATFPERETAGGRRRIACSQEGKEEGRRNETYEC